MSRPWSNEELNTLLSLYPILPTRDLAKSLPARSLSSIYQKARSLGLSKDDPYLSKLRERQLSNIINGGRDYRFVKGQVPHNKGIIGWDPGGDSHKYRFAKGNIPHTYKPIGSIITGADGYIKIKVTDDGDKHDRWKLLHNYIYESETDEAIPPNYVVIFRDGDRRNFDIDNLECIPRSELMKRNSRHRLPDDIKRVLVVKATLTRKINQAERSIGNRNRS